jgi:hypothetical protein
MILSFYSDSSNNMVVLRKFLLMSCPSLNKRRFSVYIQIGARFERR